MASIKLKLYKDNSNLVSAFLRVKKGPDAGKDLSGATVTYTLKDKDGGTVDSGSMVYSGPVNSDGFYEFYATLAYTLPLVVGDDYTFRAVGDDGAGFHYDDQETVTCEEL